jgi:hypothetical protein
MDSGRHIGTDLSTNELLFLKFWINHPEKIKTLNAERARALLDLFLKAKDHTYFGSRELYKHGILLGSYPHFVLPKGIMHSLIADVSRQLGRIEGCISLWRTQKRDLEALSQADLSPVTTLHLDKFTDYQSIVGKFPHLKILYVKDNYIDKESNLLKFILSCPELTTLVVSTNFSLPERFVKSILTLPHLSVLYLHDYILSEEEGAALVAKVESGTLKTLALTKVYFKDVEQFFELLEKGRDTLEGLFLFNMHICSFKKRHEEKSQNERLVEKITKCTGLIFLSFHIEYVLTPNDFTKILRNNPYLEEIRYRGPISQYLSPNCLATLQLFGNCLKRTDLRFQATESQVCVALKHFEKRPDVQFIGLSTPNDRYYAGNHREMDRKAETLKRFWDPEFLDNLK